jgi:hypothetical protein
MNTGHDTVGMLPNVTLGRCGGLEAGGSGGGFLASAVLGPSGVGSAVASEFVVVLLECG